MTQHSPTELMDSQNHTRRQMTKYPENAGSQMYFLTNMTSIIQFHIQWHETVAYACVCGLIKQPINAFN